MQAHQGTEARERELIEPIDNGFSQSNKAIIKMISGKLAAHKTPQSLDQVQVRAVRG